MDEMIERIERLERSVRRFRWAGGAVACLVVVGLVMGRKAVPKDTPKMLMVDTLIAKQIQAFEVAVEWELKTKSINAKSYVLKDGDDTRGIWSVLPNSSAVYLSMYSGGASDYPQVMFGVQKKGGKAILDMMSGGESGYPKLSLGSNTDGLGVTFNTSKKSFSGWYCSKDGTSELSMLFTGDKYVGCRLRASPSDGGSVELYDTQGRRRAILGRTETVTEKTGVTHRRPESSLALFDEEGNVLHQVP